MLLNITYFILAFVVMEFVAWFTHKYIMHGPLWFLHKDHHKKEHGKFFELNDIFFIIFSIPGIILIYLGFKNGGISDARLWIGLGITAYGLAYILVHDLFVHRRLKIKFLQNIKNPYFRALLKAHLRHHKYTERRPGENYGFVFLIPPKYIIEEFKKKK